MIVHDMRKFTSSGAFSSAMTSIGNAEDKYRPELNPQPPDRDIAMGDNLIWSQTDGDVELRVTNLPASITAKTIKVVIKSNRLQIRLPNDIPLSISKLQDADGGELFSSIHPDESTWTLDSSGSTKTLIVSLAKASKLRWLTFIR
jgi:hypothetical protein